MTENRILLAAFLILVYATIIGFTDNFVRVIAEEAGLWQFHLTRSVMAMALLAVVAVPLGLKLRPVNLGAVIARSTIHGLAMVIYFGALGFLPVALVAAGLFTAPIFVLLISRFFYGEVIGTTGLLAVLLGFAGAVLVLGPEAWQAHPCRPCCRSLPGRFMRWAILRPVNGAPRKAPRRFWPGSS